MPSAILQGPRPQISEFAALGHEHQARLIDLRAARHVATGAQHLHTGQMGREKPSQGVSPSIRETNVALASRWRVNNMAKNFAKKG